MYYDTLADISACVSLTGKEALLRSVVLLSRRHRLYGAAAEWDLPDVARTLDERLLKRGKEDVDLRIALGGLQEAARPFIAQYA